MSRNPAGFWITETARTAPEGAAGALGAAIGFHPRSSCPARVRPRLPMFPEQTTLRSEFGRLSRQEQAKVIRCLVSEDCPEALVCVLTGLSVELIRRIVAGALSP